MSEQARTYAELIAENERLRGLLVIEHSQVSYLSGRLCPVDERMPPHPADCPVCAALGAESKT